MPSARASRTIAMPLTELWEVIGDPHHLPRWWPRVERVEDVGAAGFTEVMRTERGKLVRADYRVLRDSQREHELTWEQQLEGTPFAHVLRESRTLLRLEPAQGAGEARAPATLVTLELHQRLNGFFARLGGAIVRRAAGRTLEQALDGLERIGG